jgi:hypothetical protein
VGYIEQCNASVILTLQLSSYFKYGTCQANVPFFGHNFFLPYENNNFLSALRRPCPPFLNVQPLWNPHQVLYCFSLSIVILTASNEGHPTELLPSTWDLYWLPSLTYGCPFCQFHRTKGFPLCCCCCCWGFHHNPGRKPLQGATIWRF